MREEMEECLGLSRNFKVVRGQKRLARALLV